MELIKLETPGIAHYSYLLEDDGDAAVIDPRRDVQVYLDEARKLGCRIKYVLETHRQEDFVLGSTHLATRTGARVVSGDHELFGHGDIRLGDGATLDLGTLQLRALHTPGHTPESMSYAVHLERDADHAWGVFTGDALFFGTTGRTDLPDPDRAEDNAALLYDSIHEKLAPLGDTTLVLPAHGAGSVCGSGMAALPMSTLGAEKRYNEVFVLSRGQFAEKKGRERIPRPPYFRHMEEVNQKGGIPPATLPGDVPLLPATEFRNTNAKVLIDTREPEAFASGHLHGAYSIWMAGLPSFGGWIAEKDTAIYLLTESECDVDQAVLHLSRIGIDGVEGALAGGFGAWRKAGEPLQRTGVITPSELFECANSVQLLDVRDVEEFEAGHIPRARHSYVGYLQEQLGSLDLSRDQTVVVTCGVGHRAGLAVSILAREGFTDVRNLLGGMKAWRELELAVE